MDGHLANILTLFFFFFSGALSLYKEFTPALARAEIPWYPCEGR